MPAPSRSSVKNATGLLKGTQALQKVSHGRRFSSNIHATSVASSNIDKHSRQIHISQQPSKPRQATASVTNTSPAPANSSDLLAALAASAWSTSPVNTGNPFLNEFPSFSNSAAEEPSPPQHVPHPSIDLSAIYWTTSPVNPGAIFTDSLFAIGPTLAIPTRSLDACDNIMASDEDYAAFLDKAAADRQPQQTSQSKTVQTNQHVNTQSLHPALQNVHQHTYVSDADEAFEPISLARDEGNSGTPDKREVAHLAGVKESDVEEVAMKTFDPRGEYKEVVKQVEQASKASVNVWRIERGGARAEYWVLGISGEGHAVGAKAKAVES